MYVYFIVLWFYTPQTIQNALNVNFKNVSGVVPDARGGGAGVARQSARNYSKLNNTVVIHYCLTYCLITIKKSINKFELGK